ncbi:hypothetical protein B9Z19DRAFT_1066644 [Tuber borchii]|uniref:Uncharacterized protein n=1 Tax=Tuber borchii TaxID=42251 RepID=A0A2T6ZLS8_TUBBO|nr:hypothetical protein B9Z19DRAFT_1066644 [Tuber borchii]
MSKITEASAPFSGPSFSPFPQNPNIPIGDVLVDGVSQKTTFPTEISIESLVPYIPRGRKPLEAPTPPLSTPGYTMANGLNFGKIAFPPSAPVFGRKIKVPRGLLVGAEPAEFAFVSEKQCKIPMSPSEAIFTAGKPIKPVRKSHLLAKELEISFADASVSPGAVFVGTGYGRLDGGDEVVEELEDEVVVGARMAGVTTESTNKSFCVQGISSQDLENSLSLALQTPLPDDDEPFSEDELFTLSLALNTPLPVDTEFDLEWALPTPEIGKEPSPEVHDDKPLLDRLEGIDKVIGGLESEAIALKSHAVTSAVTYEDPTLCLSIAVETPLPDDDELSSQDASPALSPALNTLTPDTESSSEHPLLILECESPPEAESDGKPLLEAHSAVLANDMFTAEESIGRLCKHSILLAGELESSFADTPFSWETIFGGAEMGGLEGADEVINGLEDKVVESARTPGITTKGRTDKSSCTPAVSSDSSSEDLTKSLSLALKTPLPDDDEFGSEDTSLIHSLAVSTPLPVDTESDSESPVSILQRESSLKVDERELLRNTCQDIGAVGISASPLLTKVILATREPIKPLCRHIPPVSKEPGIAFHNASVSPELISGGASLALSLALDTPLPFEAESHFERPLSDLEMESPPLESADRNKPLSEALQDVAITKSPDITISMGELDTGAANGYLEKGDRERKNINAGNEQDPVGNTHPHSHSLPIKNPSLTFKANTATAECAFDLPPQNKRSASKSETYEHCQIIKNPTITPRACATTLDPLHSHTAMSCGLSSTLSSGVSTGIGTREPDPTLVGFREAKSEFDFTDIFVGLFKEVGAVDLALSTITPSTSAGTTRSWPQDLPTDEGFHKNEVAASLVGARSATSEKKLAVRKVFAKFGKASVRERVRKGAIKLFNKFSPIPVDVVE